MGVQQARTHPELAPAGVGAGTTALQLAAGLALALAAVHVALRREFAVAGALIVATAGVGLRALPQPPNGAFLFTLALIGAGVPAVAMGHVALLHPGGHPTARLDRAAALAGYAITIGLLGVLPALVFDPQRAGCFDCPHNLLLVHGDADAAQWLARWGPRAAGVAEILLAVFVVVRVARRPAVSRLTALPVSAAAAAALTLFATTHLRAADGHAPSPTDQVLWLSAAATLGLAAIGMAWRPVRAILVRGALGRLATAAAGEGRDVRGVLGRALADPEVRLLWPHPATNQPTTQEGEAASSTPPPERVRTVVERSGRVVAWVEHREDLRGTPEVLFSAVHASSLMLEREALRAAQRMQSRELRESTLRLVSAADQERKRLERDLHDGAQQRLLALGLRLALHRTHVPPAGAAQLAVIESRLAKARDSLRSIAHGIHPVTLAEGGLGEAVLALLQTAQVDAAVDALPHAPVAPDAATAVYRLVSASLQHAAGARVRITLRTDNGAVRAAVHIEGADALALAEAVAHAGARIEALGGTLSVEPAEAGATADARLPNSR